MLDISQLPTITLSIENENQLVTGPVHIAYDRRLPTAVCLTVFGVRSVSS